MGLTWATERKFRSPSVSLVAGVDEAGRGCWAGPVYAAAVMLPEGWSHSLLDDSKKLSPEKRMTVAECLRTQAEIVWAVGIASVEEIDTHNILQATFLAMRRAVEGLRRVPHLCLVDGNRLPPLGMAGRAIVDGDALCPSIAAASILAKTARDREMKEAARLYPQYGFENHKGYGTPEHTHALAHHGPCSIHRRSFRPVRLHTRAPA